MKNLENILGKLGITGIEVDVNVEIAFAHGVITKRPSAGKKAFIAQFTGAWVEIKEQEDDALRPVRGVGSSWIDAANNLLDQIRGKRVIVSGNEMARMYVDVPQLLPTIIEQVPGQFMESQ